MNFFLVFWLMYIYSVFHSQTIKWRPTEFYKYKSVYVAVVHHFIGNIWHASR